MEEKKSKRTKVGLENNRLESVTKTPQLDFYVSVDFPVILENCMQSVVLENSVPIIIPYNTFHGHP